jgi:hypothetical protein
MLLFHGANPVQSPVSTADRIFTSDTDDVKRDADRVSNSTVLQDSKGLGLGLFVAHHSLKEIGSKLRCNVVDCHLVGQREHGKMLPACTVEMSFDLSAEVIPRSVTGPSSPGPIVADNSAASLLSHAVKPAIASSPGAVASELPLPVTQQLPPVKGASGATPPGTTSPRVLVRIHRQFFFVFLCFSQLWNLNV